MKIKGVRIGTINDSRGQKTIWININNCITAAPAGKSTGKHEVPDYKAGIKGDSAKLKVLSKLSNVDFKNFQDLSKVEKLLKNKVGANTLFALEASILKAMAAEKKKELWQILGSKKMPKLVSNTVGGGAHSVGKKPDFQEFLVIGDKKTNTKAYNAVKKLVKARGKNDENAWQTSFGNEEVLDIVKCFGKTGIDAAASQFYCSGKYCYKNPKEVRSRQAQIDYMVDLIKNYKIKYVEDPLQEDDFKGFAEILKRTKAKCLIVGDDLTVTNLKRVEKAIKMKAINALIVKPNQIGSLLEVKKVVDVCKRKGVKLIMSHRSGETLDWTIADLAVGFGCDYIKIPVSGRERLAKVARLEKIKKRI